MIQRSRGLSTEPPYLEISYAARLGTEIRKRRKERGLTLKELAARIGFSLQHLSEVELGKAPMSGRFVAACDLALGAQGRLLGLLEAVICERALLCYHQSIARQRSEGEIPDAEWEALSGALGMRRYAGLQHPSQAGADVDLSRRSLIGVGIGTAFGLDATTAAAVRELDDPRIASHWMALMRLLAGHDAMFGSRAVLDIAQNELGLIAEYRQRARGDMHSQFLRVEARWSEFASRLSNDAGDWLRRDAWADRAFRLAQEAEYADMLAYVRVRQSHWATIRQDAPQAIALAEAARRTHGTSSQVHALCALKQGHAYALANDDDSCERSLADAYGILDRADAAQTPELASHEVSMPYVLAAEARCWLWLRPSKAIAMYNDALRCWPTDRMRSRGVQQTRLALACATANEPEKAAAEGMKALEIVRTTRSDVTVRELKRLDRRLSSFDMPVVGEFREALAGRRTSEPSVVSCK